MRAFITILTIAFWTHSLGGTSLISIQPLLDKDSTRCKIEIDSVTKKTVYLIADKEPVNEGGKSALIRQFHKISLDSIPYDFDTKFIIAFVVEPNGQITGERIIKDKIGNVGKQMIKIVKTFKWTPAQCDGKKVPMLVKLPLQMCLSEN